MLCKKRVLMPPASNVDRLWAIWQGLNPDAYMSPRPAPYSTFAATGGEAQTKDTPLAPFWDKTGTKFWTSVEVRDTLTFGYAYPETQKWRFPDQKAYQAEIRRAVTALYGTNVFANFVANVAQRKEEHAVAVRSLVANEGANGAPAEKAPAASEQPPPFAAAQTLFTAMAPESNPEPPVAEEQEGKPPSPLPSQPN
jgi:tyrosinase